MSETTYIGIDIGRQIHGALVRDDGTIVKKQKVVAEVSDPRIFIKQLTDLINELRLSEEAHGHAAAAGIGWAGMVNYQQQHVEITPNIIDIAAFDLHDELQRATTLPIVFDNDANVAAYGEWRCGAAQGCSDVFFITMGTGIGSGLILGNQMQRGSRGFAGEFGHFKIGGGLECACGSVGCLETLASGPNIVRRVREQLFSDPAFSVSRLAQDMAGVINFERVVQAAQEGDQLALTVLQETAKILGAAIASVINLLNVEIVVIGGGVMTAGELILQPIRDEVFRDAIAPSQACCRIVAAKLGQQAGIIGAALLARDSLQEYE